MEPVYKRVYIKTADDLPKEYYTVHPIQSSAWFTESYHYDVEDNSYWLNTFDWYLLPVPLPSEEEQIIYFNNHSATIEIKPTGLKLPLMTRSEVLKFADWLLSKLK